MAILSNINGKFAVESTGAIQFNGSNGTAGYILKSNGNASPTWVAASTVIGGPYLPLTGGTLTGPLAGTSATFAGDVTTAQINLNSSGGGIIDNQTGNIFIQTPSGTGWIFRNGASGYDEKMRIDSSGNLLLNQATSRIKGGGSTTGRLELSNSDSKSYMMITGSTRTSDPNLIYFVNDAAVTLTLNANNSATFAGTVQTTQITATNGLNYLKRNTDASLQLRSENTRSGLFITKPATDTVMGSALVLADESYRLGTANYYHMYMLQNGNTYFTQNVGIGTTSPAGKLEIKTGSSYTGHTQPNIKLINFGYRDAELNVFAEGSYFTHYFENYSGGNGRYYDRSLEIVCKGSPDGTYGEGVIKFKANPITAGSNVAEIMRITGAGKVGIGTISPSKKLEVAGSYKLGTNAYIQYDAGYPYTINMLNTAAVGNLILNAGAGSSGYESKIELQGSNTAGAAGITLSAGSTTRMRITSDGGTFLYPSTGTYGLSMNDTNQVMNSGYVNGNQTVSLTYTCTSMSSMFIQCVFNHYGYVTSYGCARVATFAVGPVITIQNILEVTSPNGGSWTFNRVSSTEFTVVKTAGTYAGGGRWFVKINGARVFAA